MCFLDMHAYIAHARKIHKSSSRTIRVRLHMQVGDFGALDIKKVAHLLLKDL